MGNKFPVLSAEVVAFRNYFTLPKKIFLMRRRLDYNLLGKPKPSVHVRLFEARDPN